MRLLILLFTFASCSWFPEQKPEPKKKFTRNHNTDYMDCVKQSETYKKNREFQKHWRIIAQFSVTPEGKVIDPSITNSDFEEKALHHCVITRLSTITYPAPKTTTLYREMFNLDPGREN